MSLRSSEYLQFSEYRDEIESLRLTVQALRSSVRQCRAISRSEFAPDQLLLLKSEGKLSLNEKTPDNSRSSQLEATRLIDMAHQTIIVRDLDGTIRYWSQGAQEMYGFSEDEALGRKAQDLLKWQFPEGQEAVIESLSAAGVWQGKIDLNAADGRSISVFSRWALKIDEQGKTLQVIAVDHDITEQKHSEELRRTRDSAIDASNQKTRLIADLSHELRTPLSGILGMNELLMCSALTNQQRECVEAIEYSARRMLDLVNDILDLTRAEAGRLLLESAPFDLDQIISKAIETVAPSARRKNLKVMTMLLSLPYPLIGDQRRLQQVLINLLSNAVKYTDEGRITVSTAVLSQEGNRLVVRFAVSDTGIGIAEEEKKQLFVPFSQLSSASTRCDGGAGLGLTICKRIVELMGGEIGCESAKGKGSTFWFVLPLMKDSVEAGSNSLKGDASRIQRNSPDA